MNLTLLQAEGGIGQFLPLILIAIVFYFFMIRPQMKKSKEAKQFRENLGVGDKIITTGGVHGKILELGETNALISIDSGKMRIEKSSITANDQEQLANKVK